MASQHGVRSVAAPNQIVAGAADEHTVATATPNQVVSFAAINQCSTRNDAPSLPALLLLTDNKLAVARTLPQRPRLPYTNPTGRMRGIASEFPATNQLRRSSKWFRPLSGWRLV